MPPLYKLTGGGVLLNGGYIAPDPGGEQWRNYRSWLAAGGVPDPAEPILIPGPPPPSTGVCYSVKDFGAKWDGQTDDTSALNACLAAIASVGSGEMILPPGSGVITGAITATASHLTIRGAGPGATHIIFTSTTANLFVLNGTATTLRDFSVQTGFQTSTNGCLFKFNLCTDAYVSRVVVDGGFHVVQFFGAGAGPCISDCTFSFFMGNGVHYGPSHIGLARISNLNLSAAPQNSGKGIFIQAGDGFFWSNVNIALCFYGVFVQPITNGRYVANIFATNVFCDGAGRVSPGGEGWYFIGAGAGTAFVARIRLTNCWAGALLNHGVHIDHATDIVLDNCELIANQGCGVFLDTGTSHFTLANSTVTFNSVNNAGANHGVFVGANVTDFKILGNMIGTTPQFPTATQGFGVLVASGTTNRYIITKNSLYGNVTGALSDGGLGTSKITAGNLIA